MVLAKSAKQSFKLKLPRKGLPVQPLPVPAIPAEATPKPVGPGDGKGLKQLQSKWGRELIAAGWVALPTIILERQEALGLDALDINIILHIAKHWFEPGNLPHPSKGSIAKAMQVTPRTVQKRISRLHDEGFLRRIERRGPKGSRGSQTSEFEFTGLIEKATPHAVEALQQREKIRKLRMDRLQRKRPRVEDDDGGGT
jgi:DNA-binding transcriptional regulator YhcF (GntR family)